MNESESATSTEQFLAHDALVLEYRLTIATRRAAGGCNCVAYLIERKQVLFPAVFEHARKEGADPVDVFARYARGVHARHESGLSLAVAS